MEIQTTISDKVINEAFDKLLARRETILRVKSDPNTKRNTKVNFSKIAKEHNTTEGHVIAEIRATMLDFFKKTPLFKKRYLEFGFQDTVTDFVYAMSVIVAADLSV